MIDFRCKIAMGQMQQVADVNGATDVLNPDGSMTFFRGGLYALRSNIGAISATSLRSSPRWVSTSAPDSAATNPCP